MSGMKKEQIIPDGSLRTGTKHLSIILVILTLVALLMISGCVNQGILSGTPGLTILVDDPDQVDTVREVAENYQNQTGTPVQVHQIPKNWSPESGKSLSGDLLVADTGRIPVFAADHLLIPLNDQLNTSAQVNWTTFERPSLVMAGEYPDRSGTIYALPFSQDAQGIVFRADLLYDPRESASFCATYGIPLAVPGTYDDLQSLAKFFTRNDSGLGGIGFASMSGPDPRSSPWMSMVSSYGSGVLDRSSGLASGTWNRSSTISALVMLRNLTRLEVRGSETWGDKDVAAALISGRAAMVITWFSKFPGIQKTANEMNITVGYMPLPGGETPEGSHRGIMVRMDGIGILSGGSKERSLRFLNWFFSPEFQYAYAESGHQPAAVSVLDSFPYLSLNLFNRAFPESMRVGITDIRSSQADEIRQECENVTQSVLFGGVESPDSIRQALDGSAASIDRIVQMKK